jgi:hypothetical protein
MWTSRGIWRNLSQWNKKQSGNDSKSIKSVDKQQSGPGRYATREVCHNEAVELTKSFGGIDGDKYVDGVLDKLAPRLRADEVAADTRR